MESPKEILWETALKQSETADKLGALVPLKTELRRLGNRYDQEFEIRFLMDVPPNNKIIYGPKRNPFFPWDKRLELASIEEKHTLILNKYPVQKGHMLLISNDWQPQTGWLSKLDMAALEKVEQDTGGLWFFNSGPSAGASQPHRHLQLLRRSNSEICCPREYWFKKMVDGCSHVDELTRACKVTKRSSSFNLRSNSLYKAYISLAKDMNLGDPINDLKPRKAYNLLITKDWLAIITRKKEKHFGFSINGLGFAGYLLATRESRLGWLLDVGPEKLLENVVDSKV